MLKRTFILLFLSLFITGCNTNYDFTIPSTHGTFKLVDYRGKVVVIYFGYRFCPDICPTTLNELSRAYKKLAEQDKVQVLFISVDPERDTIKNLKEYVSFFHKDFIGATDTEAKIKNIAQLYGVKYSRFYEYNNTEFYSVDHSTQSFIIGKDGELKNIIPHGDSAQLITTKLKKYLKEKI
jgi:protein SCO1/2